MSILHHCGVCCYVISIWAVFQLTLMGIFYKLEITQLLEDVKEKEYDSIEEYIKKTRSNYHSCARNCWIAAGIYFAMIFISRVCIMKAERNAKRLAAEEGNDELFCSQKVALKT